MTDNQPRITNWGQEVPLVIYENGERKVVGTAKYFQDGRVEGTLKDEEGRFVHHIVGAMGLDERTQLDKRPIAVDPELIKYLRETSPVKIAMDHLKYDAVLSGYSLSGKAKKVPEGYQEKARRLVFEYISGKLEKTDKHVIFTQDDVYIVWFSKTLQNWKALVSTTLPDGMYYEVTYNGDQHETYIDAYKKFDNVCIIDEKNEHGKIYCAEDCPTCAKASEGRER